MLFPSPLKSKQLLSEKFFIKCFIFMIIKCVNLNAAPCILHEFAISFSRIFFYVKSVTLTSFE